MKKDLLDSWGELPRVKIALPPDIEKRIRVEANYLGLSLEEAAQRLFVAMARGSLGASPKRSTESRPSSRDLDKADPYRLAS